MAYKLIIVWPKQVLYTFFLWGGGGQKPLFAEGRVRYLFAEGRVRYLFAEGRVRLGAFFLWPAFKENEKSKCMPRRPKNQYSK